MRVLFLTHRLPYAPNRGDRLRAFHILRTLIAEGFDVEVLSLAHSAEEMAAVERVRALGAEATAVPVPWLRNYATGAVALAGRQPLTHVLLHAPEFRAALKRILDKREPDVVLAYCSSMARFAMEPPLASYPLVIDLVDVDSHKWAALAESAAQPKRWIYERELRYLSRFERKAAMHARATVVVNEREAESLHRIAPNAVIHVVPVGVDLAAFQPQTDPTESPNVVFCGVMNYGPNVDGVIWFSREVWPLIRAKRPEAQFTIVGSQPSAAIGRLASAPNGIQVTGAVDSVQEYLWNAAVSVAPLMTARGVQTKVLEAVAAGLPAVVTTAVFDGLPDEIHPACSVADTRELFSERVLSLLALTGAERRSTAAAADIHSLSWESQLSPLHTILADAAAGAAVGR
jgi:sugar transferase (PEP-CTERM/EpsH1 system associated)